MCLFLRILVFFLSKTIGLAGVIHYPEENYLANVRQLTFGGTSAEAYFSFDNSKIIFQANGGRLGNQCDQIFEFDLQNGDMSSAWPRKVSTGLGRTTCSFFYPDGRMLYASTHRANMHCPPEPCSKENLSENKNDTRLIDLCNNHAYLWGIEPGYDIYLTNEAGVIIQQLTNTTGYDAEGVLNYQGNKIVYTSVQSGDLELYTMDLDGKNKKQITNTLGYDGGAFFNPKGDKLVFRASRPQPNTAEAEEYQYLLKNGYVSPTKMEIFVVNSDGYSRERQVTHFGGSSWSPYYHPSGEKILFSSNHHKENKAFIFNLFMINEDGDAGSLKQITYDPVFDSFPMFSRDGSQLIFASARNASKPTDVNLFLAQWVEPAAREDQPKGSSGIVAPEIFFIAFISLLQVVKNGL